jgi:hypothetical protein
MGCYLCACFPDTTPRCVTQEIPGGPLLERLAARGQARHTITMPMQTGVHRVSEHARTRGLPLCVHSCVSRSHLFKVQPSI